MITFNEEALKINRALKKKLDKANTIVDKLLELEIYVSGAGTTDYENMLIELKETLG